MHLPPTAWGPFFWHTMHIVALGYPTKPSYSEKKAAKEFYESLQFLIPCPVCRQHYSAFLQEQAITPFLDRRQDLFRWTVDVHNKVNQTLNKPRVSEQEAIAYYSRLGKRGRSPVWTPDDFAEADMKAMIQGFGIGVGVAAAAVASLWWVSKGDSRQNRRMVSKKSRKQGKKESKDAPSDKPTVLKSDGAHLEEDEGNALSPKPENLPKAQEEKLAKIKQGVQIPKAPTQPLRKQAKKVVVVALMTDKEMAAHEGKYFEDDDKKYTIYDEDVDIYAKETPDGEEKLIGKLRKNVLAKDKVELGWENFYITAAPSRNRGAAAGPINLKSKYWLKRKPTEISKWSARYIIDGKVSKMKVNNNVFSSVLGYFESTPFMKLPCRLTSYTQKYFNYYKKGIPFIEELDKAFKTLIPDRHKVQYQAAKSKPLYQIADTAFSSLTVNRNFRTALHKDAGDFPQGYGNLSVIERGKYHGGHTLFPRFGIGFNIRTGDFLAMDVHEWHCNTAMYETEEDKAFNKTLPRIHLDNPETGTQGADKPYTRISFVCYLRLKLKNCKEAATRKYYKDIDYNSSRGSSERQFTRKKKREEEQE